MRRRYQSHLRECAWTPSEPHLMTDQLSNATIYTKLDIKDAYYNLRIAEGDE